MGWLDDLGDAIGDVGDAVVGAAEVLVDTVTEVGGAVAGAAVSTGSSIFEFGSDLSAPIWGLGGGVIDVISDPVGAAQALGDIITDPVGAVEGAFGAVIDYGVGLGSNVGDIGSSVFHGVYGVGEAVVGVVGELTPDPPHATPKNPIESATTRFLRGFTGGIVTHRHASTLVAPKPTNRPQSHLLKRLGFAREVNRSAGRWLQLVEHRVSLELAVALHRFDTKLSGKTGRSKCDWLR